MTGDPLRAALAGLTRYAMVGNLTDRHMQAVSDGEYVLRGAVLAALDRSEPAAGLREAAQAVVANAEPDEGHEGFVDYLVEARYIEALRAATTTASPTARHHEIGTRPECEWCARFIAIEETGERRRSASPTATGETTE